MEKKQKNIKFINKLLKKKIICGIVYMTKNGQIKIFI